MKYMISGDGTGKTYGIYEIKDGEVMPPVAREPILKGIPTFKDAQKIIHEKEMKRS